MKTFQQFSEDAGKRVNAFIEKEVLANPSVQNLMKDLKGGNINLEIMQKLSKDKNIRELPNKGKNLMGDLITNFGQSLTTDNKK